MKCFACFDWRISSIIIQKYFQTLLCLYKCVLINTIKHCTFDLEVRCLQTDFQTWKPQTNVMVISLPECIMGEHHQVVRVGGCAGIHFQLFVGWRLLGCNWLWCWFHRYISIFLADYGHNTSLTFKQLRYWVLCWPR